MSALVEHHGDIGVDMANRYAQAFASYCRKGHEDDLMAAYDLARQALADKLTLADFGALHHAAMREWLVGRSRDPLWIDRAEDFYLEGVAVFDMAIHGYQSNVAALQIEISERRRVEEELRDVTFELARQRDELDVQVQNRTKELQHRAEQLELANRQLKHTNREQADFTYALSHDLKTPINTIDMFLDTLLEDTGGTLDQDALELITIASATAARMKQLIDDVLEYSRVVEDEFKEASVDLNCILQDVVRDAAATIKSKGADVRCRPLQSVDGSAFQLSMLFANLLSNALRYSAADRVPKIEISAIPATEAGHVVVSVSDNGIGMQRDHIEKIFGLFKRLHRFDEIKGSGIGLALCKRVADNHATEIVVESAEGVGSRFSIKLKASEV